jgi:hypothetical protein
MASDAEHKPARFVFDEQRFTAWVGDAQTGHTIRGRHDRDVATMIDKVFADAVEAEAITPPAHLPQLKVDVRQSRSCVLVVLTEAAGPMVTSRPLWVREVHGGRGFKETCLTLRHIIEERANPLLPYFESMLRAHFTLTESQLDRLEAGESIKVPGGPHDQHVVLAADDFAPDDIERLGEGDRVSVDGFTVAFQAPIA